MNNLNIVLLTVGLTASSFAMSSEQNEKPNGGKSGGQRPTTDQLFAQMDANQDDQLSESEIKGPLAKNFSTIDSNSDGYISKDELNNAPKPKGGSQNGKSRPE